MIKLAESIINNLVLESEKKIKSSDKYRVEQIELINKEIINLNNGIIYQIYVAEKTKISLKYIGKSRGKYFKTRLKAHFKNIGKGTKSKFDLISSELKKGNDVYFKFIELSPDSLRNLIEEELIKKTKINDLKLWNYKKTAHNKV
jgi:hypothetical protein